MATPLPPKQVVVLAIAEGCVIASAVLRVALMGVDVGHGPNLIWLVAVVVLAGVGMSYFVFRMQVLARSAERDEDQSEARRQLMATALAIIALAGVVSVMGPGVVARLLGG